MARDFGRWFRFYDAVLDDPKVQRLSDPLFRTWVNLMCLASRGGGQFSDNLDEIGFALRVSPAQASKLIEGLTKAGLLEHIDERFEPHNWNERQFKSDVSTERVKRFRQRSTKRSETVSETPPEAETDTEADQKQKGAATQTAKPSPGTPLDFKKEVWSRGVPFLVGCGCDEPAARSMLGKWRRDHGDVEVINALASAEGAAVSEPIAYIQKMLNSKGKSNGSGQLGATHALGTFGAAIERHRARTRPDTDA